VNSDDVRLQFQRDEAARELNNETNWWWNNFYFWQSKQVERDTERAAERSREANSLAWADGTSLPDPGVGGQQPGGLSEIRDYEPTRDDGLRDLAAPLPQLGLSGEPQTRDPAPDAMARPDADVSGRPPPDPPPTLPLSTPSALADPVLRELLPSDPDTATRLLSDLTLIGDRMDAAAAQRANGNVAQAQAAERAARQVYDFWSAFYRNQERIALIAERLHELTVASIESAEADRVAGQRAAQTVDGVVELSPKTYSEMTGAAEEPHPYRQGYLNGVFMEEALAKIKDEDHPLHDLLYDSKRENWTSRADDADEPTVQAGHLVSRHAGLREYFALEDSSLNQLSGQQGETQGAIFVKTAIDIEGIPVERRTAELWEKQGKLDAGTVENPQPHPGWTRIRKPRKTRKATT
jgi:hypothetical protein